MVFTTGIFEEGFNSSGSSPPKEEDTIKKWLNIIVDLLKIFARKAVEELLAIVGRVVGAILTFLRKLVGYLDKHTRALTVFISGFVGLWLMEKVKNVGIIQG